MKSRNEIVESQGWTDKTLLELALSFVTELGMDEELNVFLLEHTKEGY